MKLKYFKNEEFDDRDVEGSWIHMHDDFLHAIDKAREISVIPWRITSAFRTQETNQRLLRSGYKASPTSEHLHGCGIDVSCTNAADAWKIVSAAKDVGISRVGISKGFIHLGWGDKIGIKQPDRIWTY